MEMNVEEKAIRRYEERKNFPKFDRRRDSKEPKEIHEAMKLIKESVNKLTVYVGKIEVEPKKVFELTEGQFDTIRKVIGISEQEHEVMVHDFQVYIVEVANRYFKDWLKEKGIDKDYHIQVRNDSMFPSISAVYLDDMEVMQVNIYKQRYGVRRKILTDKDFTKTILAESRVLENQIDIQNKRIEKERLRKDQPMKVYTTLKDKINWLFMDKDVWRDAINERIQREIDERDRLEVEGLVKDKEYLQREQENIKFREGVEDIEPFFTGLMYQEELDQINLY